MADDDPAKESPASGSQQGGMEQILNADPTTDTFAFFREFYAHLYRLVWTWTRRAHEEVEEIVQDVLLHAWKDRANYRGESSWTTWITAIARHRILELRRKQERAGRADVVLRAISRLDTEAVAPDALESSELKAQVWAALDRVGPEYADLLLKCYGEDRSVRSIAQELGDTEKAVESRLTRAREAFRRELGRGSA